VNEIEPESGLQEVVHQRVRLGVLAVLDRRGRSTFSQLRDVLRQSDGSLSRHLGVLEEHGYITSEKVFENRRPRTWVSITEAGVRALDEEREILSKMLAAAGDSGAQGDDLTSIVTIAFASLLADEEDRGESATADLPSDSSSGVPFSALVPADPAPIVEHGGRPAAHGPISARYEFPPTHRQFGEEQRAQRLMMLSHGLRGGWVSSWRIGDGESNAVLAVHMMILELGGAADARSILSVMGDSSLPLASLPESRGYLIPDTRADLSAAPAAARQAVTCAWFALGAHLALTVLTGQRDLAVELIEPLAVVLDDHLREVIETHS
jgi:DNA-binding MarR family transcriptional regulator